MYIIHNSCYSGTDSGKGLRGSGTLGPKKKDLVGKFFPKKKKKGLGPPYQNDLAPIPAGQPSQEHISACKSKKKKCKKEKKKTENEGKNEKRKERRDRHSEKKNSRRHHASRLTLPPVPVAYGIPKRETATPTPPPSPRPRETHLDSCRRLLNLPSPASLLQLNSQVFNLSFPSFLQNLI